MHPEDMSPAFLQRQRAHLRLRIPCLLPDPPWAVGSVAQGPTTLSFGSLFGDSLGLTRYFTRRIILGAATSDEIKRFPRP